MKTETTFDPWPAHAPVDLWHRVARFDRRGLLIHPGAQPMREREKRLEAFLLRQGPDLEERAARQVIRGVLSRREAPRDQGG